jgi:flavin-dependent dehydrogenase
MGRGPNSSLVLDDGARVGVVGGGPAGSLFSYFLLQVAERVGLDLQVDVYEWRDFKRPGPAGCNMCGGIVSESLVESLAAEGINLPPTVVRRAIDSYVLHMDVGTVRFETPLHEMRIASAHRGAGPRGTTELKWESFDGFLLELAQQKGARVVRGRVDDVALRDGRPQVRTRDGETASYDLLVPAVGVNSKALDLFKQVAPDYRPPRTRKTYICEFHLGQDVVEACLGSSMHVFLLNIPRLEFAALIPKGDHATLCLLGRDIDQPLVDSFLAADEVRACFPPGQGVPKPACRCWPHISSQGAVNPFADRVVFVGDCGVTRLYKDGIGAAYRTAKAAAVTAVFEGISASDFRRRYWPTCKAMEADNRLGEVVFAITRQIQRTRLARRGVVRVVAGEQSRDGARRRMSRMLWDTFTGSAPYRSVFMRGFHPAFISQLIRDLTVGALSSRTQRS